MDQNARRLATISIIINNRHVSSKVNDILSTHGDIIRGRLGIPYPERDISVVVILADATNAEIGAVTGALGNVPGVTLRSVMLV